MKRPLLTASAAVALSIATWSTVGLAAAPTIDGTLDTSVYGTPISVQQVQTAFGDNNNTFTSWANGSELDASYAKISGGNLYLFLAGNLESNFNKLELFFDTGTPGQNTIRRDNADVNYNALGRMGENLDGTNPAGNNASGQIGKGLTFDAGFNASYYIDVSGGYDTPSNDFRLYADYATTPADPTNPATPSTGVYVGSSTTANNTLITGANGINVAINNLNTAGVTGGSGAVTSDQHPELVTTGVEIAIPLSQLGNPTSPIKISAFINGSSHDYLSNQILGSVIPNPDFGNLAEPRTTDFSTLDGDQFFSVSLLPGDANGDGVISADDYALTDRGAAKHLTGWSNGDFDGNGVVNSDDYMLLDQSFIDQNGYAPASLIADRESQFGDAYVQSLLASVPEPTSLLAACGFVLPLITRRRSR